MEVKYVFFFFNRSDYYYKKKVRQREGRQIYSLGKFRFLFIYLQLVGGIFLWRNVFFCVISFLLFKQYFWKNIKVLYYIGIIIN